MGAVDDYINSLDDKENLDPVVIAATLAELHNQEISTRDAKIEELTGTIAEKDSAFIAAQEEITKQKARNFDLAMQIPGVSIDKKPASVSDPDTVTIDDLFQK